MIVRRPADGGCFGPGAGAGSRRRPKEACGVFGVRDPRQPAVHLTCLGLFALQHRGQESAGIAVNDGTKIMIDKDMGRPHSRSFVVAGVGTMLLRRRKQW
ncbi:MAG TPA: hypothetical protein VFG35_27150 [Actinoplanes sp.]|nr:hypothetical protein [Actinoplanes sp.]